MTQERIINFEDDITVEKLNNTRDFQKEVLPLDYQSSFKERLICEYLYTLI